MYTVLCRETFPMVAEVLTAATGCLAEDDADASRSRTAHKASIAGCDTSVRVVCGTELRLRTCLPACDSRLCLRSCFLGGGSY
jgi:hypothetical protein